MPVKMRAAKERRHRITPEVVEAFAAALKLREHRENQIGDSESCAGIDSCETCQAYERHVAIVSRHLRVKPWQIHPVDVANCPPPPWFKDANAKAWESARALYCELCDAAGIEPSARVEVSDIMRSHIALRWIERFCIIPEGGTVGQPVRLRSWQRDIIRKIYGHGFGDAAPTFAALLRHVEERSRQANRTSGSLLGCLTTKQPPRLKPCAVRQWCARWEKPL